MVPIGTDFNLQCGHGDEGFRSAVLFSSSIRPFYSPVRAETCVTIVMIAQAVTAPIVCGNESKDTLARAA